MTIHHSRPKSDPSPHYVKAVQRVPEVYGGEEVFVEEERICGTPCGKTRLYISA